VEDSKGKRIFKDGPELVKGYVGSLNPVKAAPPTRSAEEEKPHDPRCPGGRSAEHVTRQ
jgi:hypothetical protein